jgi:hypothetical protein
MNAAAGEGALGLTIGQAAKEYGVSQRRLSALVKKGVIEADLSMPRRACIPRRALDAYFRPQLPAQVLDLDVLRDALRLVVREELAAALDGAHLSLRRL